MAALFKAMLGGIQDIGNAGLVWTDAKPANVLWSDVDGPSPIIKIADLGLAGTTGYKKRALQPLAMRAPEVFTGCGCFHSSDVWSIGATIVCWLQPNVLGPHDNKLDSLFEESWCVAKIMRLFENGEVKIPKPPPEAEEVTHIIYNLARDLLTQPDDGTEESMHVPARPFHKVVQDLGVSPEVEALLQRFFVLRHEERPTAEELLKSREFEALQALAHRSSLKLNEPTDTDTMSQVLRASKI